MEVDACGVEKQTRAVGMARHMNMAPNWKHNTEQQERGQSVAGAEPAEDFAMITSSRCSYSTQLRAEVTMIPTVWGKTQGQKKLHLDEECLDLITESFKSDEMLTPVAA